MDGFEIRGRNFGQAIEYVVAEELLFSPNLKMSLIVTSILVHRVIAELTQQTLCFGRVAATDRFSERCFLK